MQATLRRLAALALLAQAVAFAPALAPSRCLTAPRLFCPHPLSRSLARGAPAGIMGLVGRSVLASTEAKVKLPSIP